ncbi:restriction endonuclease subunit S [Porphyromonas gingivalis]|uniref:restriction endonuclease subunit S n=1 Tax=Porphyromonas gingivalis TaxID=837 RepID=UPI001F1B77F4|nr:restriction endonuclease subunit S [Porphyromonas gingivalis]MCE8189706.1 restriction endonuclease subunit S [Porphyromonas gingivalis]
MKRYDKYKESGISWIGDIPEHWEMKRLKSRLSLVKDRGANSIKVGLENIESFTGRFFPSESLFDGEGVQVHIGDIVYGKLRPYLCKVWLASFECSAIGDFYVFRCGSDCDKRFMSYLFLSAPFTGVCNASTYGAKMPRVSSNFMLSLPISLPPLSEQETIVAYLEEKVTQMDNLVAKREAQIAYLRELKQAVIAKAVTQGIDPQAPLCPSGIPWIGNIPEHWEEVKMRKIIDFFSDKGYPDETLLSVVRERGVIIRDTESKEENHNYIPSDLSGYKRVQQGDFVINKMKAWQGSYAVSDYQGIVSPAYYTCKLRIPNKVFFNLAIRSKVYVPFFTQYSKGIRVDQWDLSPIGLKDIPFFLPPPSEQEAIVTYINRKTEEIDRLIAMTEQEIARVRELKQTVIADVVTGRINVQPS